MEQAEANQIRFREIDQDGNPVDPAVARPQDQPRSGLDRPGRRSANPFIIILWVLAAILLTGGIWAFLEASQTLGSGSNPMPLHFVLMNIAPWAVLSGALAVLALLFWHAAQWQQRRKQ